MVLGEKVGLSQPQEKNVLPTSGSYVLKKLVECVPLSPEGRTEHVQITCVELCESNLYIGTSAAEILHFVSIPADPTDDSAGATFIFASRLQPTYTQSQGNSDQGSGVQQIVVLPAVDKACILCNGTLSFYSLPELTPAFANAVVSNCSWVGGANLNVDVGAERDGEVIMVCVKSRIRLLRIGDEARRVRNIDYPGCLVSARRDNFACVADAHSYALLDIENQQKISLFPISSLDENASTGQVEDISTPASSTKAGSASRSRPTSSEGVAQGRGHGRSTSLGTFASGLGLRQSSPQPRNQDRSTLNTPEPLLRANSPSTSPSRNRSGSTAGSPSRAASISEKPLPAPPEQENGHRRLPSSLSEPLHRLTPHICSPTPTEFLLTTGTAPTEPGVGIFVNLDGDVVRGTMEFSRYPSTVLVDRSSSELESTRGAGNEDQEGYVLATMMKSGDNSGENVIEIQRWNGDNGEDKEWLTVPTASGEESGTEDDVASVNHAIGLRVLQTAVLIPFREVGEVLRATRLTMATESNSNPRAEENSERSAGGWEITRNKEEKEFGQRLGGRESRIAVWSGSSIWWIVKNPLATRLDARINGIFETSAKGVSPSLVDRSKIIHIVNSIRGQEASTETEFLSLEYVRQKISLILCAELLTKPSILPQIQGADRRITEGLMIEGSVDPRVMLTMIPQLRQEIIEGPKGIWIHAGLVPTIEHYWSMRSVENDTKEQFLDPSNTEVTNLVKRYLYAWRQRKGFGSIADEAEVFQTVDAALLHILLQLDARQLRTSFISTSERTELYALVDSGVECFDRAVTLLEEHQRLYVLSRLFQSRKMFRKVLETWVRIIEGDEDAGGELIDGENEVRKYLAKIKDISLITEFGTWLARRNPALGVQVFTDDSSRVKLEPLQVKQLLKKRAPDAVKVYLEHLVFGKKNVQHANDLISYYLDSVLAVLGSSEDARDVLSQSYESYRALRPPKPTYRQFIIENQVPFPWWHDRLRLLELLGGSHGADFSYDVSEILSRIEPFEQDLVPESIIIDGRQGRHQQAIRLLTHGLGDYHTAINYCLLGGASIFHPISGPVAPIAAPSREEQAILFGYLLSEFLRIEDINDRLERTSELLDRFGSWYDVSQVLELIPEAWSVELVSGFLISALRRLVQEKSEAMITKALSGAENLQVASTFVEKCSALGPQIEKIQ